MSFPQADTLYYLNNEYREDNDNANSCITLVDNNEVFSIVLGPSPAPRTFVNACLWSFIASDTTEGAWNIYNQGSNQYLGINADDNTVVAQATAYDWNVTYDETTRESAIVQADNTTKAMAGDTAANSNAIILVNTNDPSVQEKDRKWKYAVATVAV